MHFKVLLEVFVSVIVGRRMYGWCNFSMTEWNDLCPEQNQKQREKKTAKQKRSNNKVEHAEIIYIV